MFKLKKAFTLVELLVVIAIIGLIATLSVIALGNARAKSRDVKRTSDIKQLQTALELFFNDEGRYPTVNEWDTGSLYSVGTFGTTTYISRIPIPPINIDGDCSSSSYDYQVSLDGSSYNLSFCLGNNTGSLDAGSKIASPEGIINGSVLRFSQVYGDGSLQHANALVQTSDGGYALAGNNNASGSYDFYLIKTDASGNVIWEETYGDGSVQSANALVQTSDGGYALLGTSNSSGSDDFYLVKTDSSGTLVWEATYGNGSIQQAYSLVQTSDGGYALAGTNNSSGDYDFYLVKTDSFGNVVWEEIYAVAGSQEANALVQTSDGQMLKNLASCQIILTTNIIFSYDDQRQFRPIDREKLYPYITERLLF